MILNSCIRRWSVSRLLGLLIITQIVYSSYIQREIPDSVLPNITSPTQFATSSAPYRCFKNSGVCETTPGVKTYSGYIQIGKNQSMFFWFFEARNNPKTAPFTVWLNGGPACSSLVGLFQANGPCTIDADGASSKLNPYPWNEYANMIYVDQPINTGFSYGTNDVYTTQQAAPEFWNFFQKLFATDPFAEYKSRDFGIWSESYGGHYGPVFAEYFIAQNRLIKAKKLNATPIRLTAIVINNGWFDPLIQYASYPDFALAKFNGLFDTADQTTLNQARTALTKDGGCLSQLRKCKETSNSRVCNAADLYCESEVTDPSLGNQNICYFSRNASDDFPPISFLAYLERPEVLRAIGSESNYDVWAEAGFRQFKSVGDGARSTIPALARVLEQGLWTLIWAGDFDFICNWLGGYRAIEAMQWKYQAAFRNAHRKNLEIRGSMVGLYKTAGPLTFIRVFGAGHALPAYKSEAALEIFKQTMRQQPIHNVS